MSSTTLWPSELVEQAEEYWKSPQGIQKRIEMIGEQFTYKIVNNAVKVYGKTDGARWLVWYTQADERVCPICGMRHMRRYHITWFTPRMPAHPNCFIPETLVDTIRGLIPIENVIAGDYVLTHRNRYRKVIQTHCRPFKGDIHRIMGNGLTGGHPVLTPDGWRRADSLDEGNEAVVSTLGVEGKPSSIHLEPDEMPPSIAEKHLFTPVIPSLSPGFVPVAPINFHGQLDLGEGEVEVIDFKGILRYNLDPMRLECGEEPVFESGELGESLHGQSTLDSLLPHSFSSPRGFMGSPDLCLPLIGTHLTPLQGLGLTLPPDRHAGSLKPVADAASAHPEVLGDGVLGHPLFNVEPDDLVEGQVDSKLQYMTPTLNDIDITPYKGLVYNLTVTEDESYAVGDARLLVHNCRCYWMVEYE